jgi:hypothetical protein
MGAGWAWLLGIIGEGLGVVSNLVSIGIGASNGNAGSAISSNALGLLIGIGIIVYLNSAQVKAYFGR